MTGKLTRKVVSGLHRGVVLAIVLSLLLPYAVFADTLNDTLVGGQNKDLGTINRNSSGTGSVGLAVDCTGQKHATRTSLSFTVEKTLKSGSAGSTDELSVSPSVSIPSDWPADETNCPSTTLQALGTAALTATIPSNATSGTRTITVKISSTDADVSGNAVFDVTYTVPTNTAPTTPGTPALATGSSTPNKGAFTLGWTASTDSEGNAITYTLQHKDANDTAYSDVAAGISGNSYTFGGESGNADEAEGTWTYQVKASDGSLSSAYSSASSAVKADRTAPSAPNASFRAADYSPVGAAAWYKDTVSVSYGGSSDPALPDGSVGSGGLTYTAAQELNTNGANPYSSKATDAAGNASTATSGSLNVDTTNPVANCGNADGNWHKTNVSIACSPSDTGSGLATANSFNLSTDVADGSQTANASTNSSTVRDNVGHEVTAGPIAGNKVDRKAPEFQCGDARGTWDKTDASIACTAGDGTGGSGLTGSSPSSFNLSTNVAADTDDSNASTNSQQLADVAGNTVTAGPISGNKVDKKAPVVTPADDIDSTGWHKAGVTKAFEATDGTGSGLAKSEDASFSLSVSKESASASAPTTASRTVTDNAGNSTTRTVSRRIDLTAPSITASAKKADGTAYTSGTWTNQTVTVSFECSDALSGLAGACPAEVVVDSDTPDAGQDISGSVSDNAGNSTTSNIVNVKVDKSAPSISGSDVNNTTWRNTNLSADFTASDSGSGLANSADAEFTLTASEESASASAPTTVSRTVTDVAGNSATRTVSALIDRTAPVILNGGPATPPNAAGWYNSAVTNGFTASDALSGLADATQASFNKDSGTAEGSAVKIASGSVSDIAGNTNAGIESAAFRIDMTAPSVEYKSASPNPNEAGWHKTDVTATFEATDRLSGFTVNDAASTTKTGTATTSGEGTTVTVGSPAFTDLAGNTVAAGNKTSDPYKIDKSDPYDVQFVDGPADGGSYEYGDTPAAPKCTAKDDISGVASCNVSGYSTAVGTHTMTATATDNAGRTATATRSYTVKSWTVKGFYSPVNMGIDPATGKQWVNTVKNGSTVPMKFEAFKGATELTDTSIVTMSVKQITGINGTEDSIETTTTGSTSLRYDTTGGQFVYNWKTPTTAGSSYSVTATFVDGSKIIAYFKLK